MQITRFPSLTDEQFLGCTSAFIDALSGELNGAAMYLRKLEGQRKGAAFAFEMALDRHRYGTLILLDRWAEATRAFGRPADIAAAEEMVRRVNDTIDVAAEYSVEVVTACMLGWQTVQRAFERERLAAEEAASLGPMVSDDYRSARRIFAADLAAR